MRYILALLILIIPACGTTVITPQTPREGLVLAELQYTAAMNTLEKLIDIGKIQEQDKPHIAAMVIDVRAAMDKAHITVMSGGDSKSALSTVNTLLTELVKYLNSKEQT